MNFKILMKSLGFAFLATIACIGVLAIIIGLIVAYWYLLSNCFTSTIIGSFILVLFIGLTALFYEDFTVDNKKNNE